ncbi:DUF4232 domain-containing protein [Mycobacterium sp. pR1184]|uniref:DUF4232 domain-containing protein n=1 Tax=Mycobacterium sp. pR1184 TaxID=3238981 RepID=UPI00351ADC92
MPESRGQRARCLFLSIAAAATSYAVAGVLGPHALAVPVGDQAVPCRSEQVDVAASPTQAAVGHRSVTLTFSLAGGAEPCTLTGYPAVETGEGGPDIHAKPTLRGYMGGLPSDVDEPPTVTLSLASQGQAIVEGLAVDRKGNPCPNYTALQVNPPNTIIVLTVPVTIDACELQVHPVTAAQQ